MDRLRQLTGKLDLFRAKISPARNKLIGHLDRNSVLSGQSLGGVPQAERDQFWLDLQDVVQIVRLSDRLEDAQWVPIKGVKAAILRHCYLAAKA